MLSSPAISVVVPAYNRERYVGAALDSLVTQTEPPLEVIVVDDCSTDGTRDRVKSHFLWPRVRYHMQAANRGASVARNIGVEMARGGIVVFLDSDDLLEPEHHAVVREVMQRSPSVGLFCCDCRMIGPAGEPLAQLTFSEIQCVIKSWQIGTGPRSLEDIFLFSTPFPGMAVRRELYQELGGLDQALFPLDDYDLQIRVAAAGHRVHYEHRPLARYRIHGGNESGAGNAIRVGRQKLSCLERALTRHPQLQSLGRRARRRIGEARREVALSLLKGRVLRAGVIGLLRSFAEDPAGMNELAQIALRRLRRRRAGAGP